MEEKITPPFSAKEQARLAAEAAQATNKSAITVMESAEENATKAKAEADKAEADRKKLIHNERVKLVAANLDRGSTLMLTVGVFGPIAAFLFSAENSIKIELFALKLAFIGLFFWAAGFLHDRAKKKLEELR